MPQGNDGELERLENGKWEGEMVGVVDVCGGELLCWPEVVDCGYKQGASGALTLPALRSELRRR